MALSKRSLDQAKQVLKEIYDSGVDAIVTRATLDKKIEQVKFPFLKVISEKFYKEKNLTVYANQQYNPIRYWLIDNWFLTSEKTNGIYTYYVNRNRIREYLMGIIEIPNKNKKAVKQKVELEIDRTLDEVSNEDYEKMCNVLAKYNITPDQFDAKATKEFYSKKETTVGGAYKSAYYDLLEQYKESEAKSESSYIVTSKLGNEYLGIMSFGKLTKFFESKDPDHYCVYEIAKEVKLTKETTIKIK
jgi:hypothetical protein